MGKRTHSHSVTTNTFSSNRVQGFRELRLSTVSCCSAPPFCFNTTYSSELLQAMLVVGAAFSAPPSQLVCCRCRFHPVDPCRRSLSRSGHRRASLFRWHFLCCLLASCAMCELLDSFGRTKLALAGVPSLSTRCVGRLGVILCRMRFDLQLPEAGTNYK